MKRSFHRLFALAAVALVPVFAGCNGMGGLGGISEPPAPMRGTCLEAVPGRSVLGTQFVSSGPIDGKLRTFVQAANDLGGVGTQAENEVAQACFRIGVDLGVQPGAMAPRQEAGGRATGACLAAAAAVDGFMRQGASVVVRATPPMCSPSFMAGNQCTSACTANPNDAECNASCRVHANAYGSCSPPLVVVTPAFGANPQAFRLAATLQANLPALMHAEVALGRRLMPDAQIVRQVGMNLPSLVGPAGAQATGCIGAATDEASTASYQLDASIRASASITRRVGAI